MQESWVITNIESVRNGETVAFCVFGRGTGDEMGRNELSVFVYNERKWGDMGRNRLSPLEMGIRGGGRVSKIPMLKRSGDR
jgi:hypothetical protein